MAEQPFPFQLFNARRKHLALCREYGLTWANHKAGAENTQRIEFLEAEIEASAHRLGLLIQMVITR